MLAASVEGWQHWRETAWQRADLPNYHPGLSANERAKLDELYDAQFAAELAARANQ